MFFDGDVSDHLRNARVDNERIAVLLKLLVVVRRLIQSQLKAVAASARAEQNAQRHTVVLVDLFFEQSRDFLMGLGCNRDHNLFPPSTGSPDRPIRNKPYTPRGMLSDECNFVNDCIGV